MDAIEEEYMPCYFTCKSYVEMGNAKDNKCTECKTGYECKNYSDGVNIYYKICYYNYYFDKDNNHYCTENSNCSEDYNKLIPKKKMCIDDFNKDSIYIYYSEYDNSYHKNCPKDIIHSDNNICIFKKAEY